MKNLFLLILFIPYISIAQEINIIPQPVQTKVTPGNLTITPSTVLVVTDEGDQWAADFFASYLRRYYSLDLKTVKSATSNFIKLNTLKFIQPGTEGKYHLRSEKNGVIIEGDTYSGTFYGVQTLIQLLPIKTDRSLLVRIPLCDIMDQPRFAYRGLHLDVGRHFFPLEFIKKYIDYIALHKMNYFHWHLTEDQGWRIEIKKYPKLTEVGGWRNGTIIGRYPGKGNDNIRYGGYYTKDEVKEIVQYAAERHIIVMPEIEMPGHSSAAIAAYPELSCFPGQPTKIPATMISKASVDQQKQGRVKLVQETWGVFDDVFCAGKEETFQFLEGVLDEVIELFPSKLFHVGGDESPKTHWKKCPNCQKRMKDNNLKDEHELQSYFIQRMEKYLNNKGRTLIGWDEILEGGLEPNAIVMSWRGEQGGIDAAQQNHQVVMTPGSHVYLDHQQTEKEDSVTIGGYTSVEKVYSYEPIPAKLTVQQGKYVLGAQGNVWTEYMKNIRKVEYQILPRLSALSEVLWSPKAIRKWEWFEKKLQEQFKRYELWDANYSKAYFELKSTVLPTRNRSGLLWKLETKLKNSRITFSTGNSSLDLDYKTPVVIRKSQSYTSRLYKNGKIITSIAQPFFINKATGKKISLIHQPASNYPGDGSFTLVNGIQNELGRTRSKEFLGFLGTDCEAVIDLGSIQKISSVIVHSFHQSASWIYRPQSVEVFNSIDLKSFTSIGNTETFKDSTTGNGTLKVVFNKPITTRFVKVLVKNWGIIPEGNPGAGTRAWLFVDEIEIN